MPAEARRRDAVDVARSLALLVVVAGHLLLAVVDRHDGTLRGTNLLALAPQWQPLAVLSPMPVFFAAAGWAGAASSPASAMRRLRPLVGLAAVVVGTWSLAVVGATALTGEAGLTGRAARLATQPLWFLAAYVPLALAAGAIGRAAARRGPQLLLSALIALVVLDTARFRYGLPPLAAWAAFPLAWAVPWVAGAWWRHLHARGTLRERRLGLVSALAAAAVAAALVRWGGYAPALIDAVPGQRSNTTPPTLFTAVAGLAQTGVLVALAPTLDQVGRRGRRAWDRVGAVAVPVYCWHLTALALVTGAVALGVPQPERLTAAWWALRPVWWAVVLAATAALVAATTAVSRRRASAGGVPQLRRGAGGAVLAAAGAAVVGLHGPTDVPWALTCTALVAAGWRLLVPSAARRSG